MTEDGGDYEAKHIMQRLVVVKEDWEDEWKKAVKACDQAEEELDNQLVVMTDDGGVEDDGEKAGEACEQDEDESDTQSVAIYDDGGKHDDKHANFTKEVGVMEKLKAWKKNAKDCEAAEE